MQAASRLHQTLRGSKPLSLGAWQMLPGTHISRSIARAGYDWICVDTEHGNIDDSAMHDCVGAIAGSGVSPIVRVPANEGWMFKQTKMTKSLGALDSGAHGIVVPLIKTTEDARNVVAACKFPPQGSRGFGSPFPMASFGEFSQVEYLQEANETLFTIIQIETREALSNLEEIAKVPGIDVLFVGPFDLGNSMGFPIISEIAPELREAIARILQVATANGKLAGVYATSSDQAKDYIRQGFHMVSVANDATTLASNMALALAQAQA